MDKSFDFGALLKNNEKKHKSKPLQFTSVAGGIQKRLETNIKNRKSTRLTTFDSVRNLPVCDSPGPAPVSEAKMKMEHRRQQLEKWKAEKEQKKKEQAANKKKPFITGVAKHTMKFEPPPPPKPSTSGRVTRSQTRTATLKPKPKPSPVKSTAKSRSTQSFAPRNATFKPPEIKNLVKLPTLAPPSRTRNKPSTITFEPVIPNAVTTGKQVRNRPVLTRQNATEIKPSMTNAAQSRTKNTRGKIIKPSPKKQAKKPLQSSSSSDLDAAISQIQNPSRKSFNGPKHMTPKVLIMQSTSDEKSSTDSSNSSTDQFRRRSLRKFTYSIRDQTSSDKSSDVPSSIDEPTVVLKPLPRKSLPKNFSPATSNSDRISSASDVEIIEEKSPIVKTTRKSVPLTPKHKSPKTNSSSSASDVEKSPVIMTRKSLATTPKNKIPKSESSSEEKLRSPRSPIELSLTPEQMESAKISPCVTMSRGKDNARKEMKWKMDEGLLDDDVSDIDSVTHFRKQLSSEIKRMSEMCDTWDKISEQTVLPEPVQEAVLSAVGQCRLLMSQKLQQFASLVERCARPEPGTALVTPADLHGFWDMVFMQVENVDLRFKALEELRQRNWVEDKPVPKKKPLAKKPAKQLAKPTGGASRIREMIAAARKAKQTQPPASPAVNIAAPSTDNEKTFDAGFFSVRSPVRSPAMHSPCTPRSKPTLLKAVLSSEAKKASNSKSSTPFAMLRASMLAKHAECEGVAPLPQTPQTQHMPLATPGRSILKSAADLQKSGKKSVKVVLFDASDTESSPASGVRNKNSDVYDTALDDTPLHTTSKNLVQIQDKENSQTTEVRPKTRNQRKSILNSSNVEETVPQETRKSTRNKKVDDEVKTPIRSSGRNKKSTDNAEVKSTSKKTTRKSKTPLQEANVLDETLPTTKRSTRRNRVSTVF
ncbi:hypothetical protein O0L34_g16633 [Tuta absoluta]|nr:hypothetical protein O0L34_g16633 [Tuta absoluta]